MVSLRDRDLCNLLWGYTVLVNIALCNQCKETVRTHHPKRLHKIQNEPLRHCLRHIGQWCIRPEAQDYVHQTSIY